MHESDIELGLGLHPLRIPAELLAGRGVDVSEIFHDENGSNGAGFRIGNAGRASGRDPGSLTVLDSASNVAGASY